MGVPVVNVRVVGVGVNHGLVLVFVFAPLRQMQPDADAYERSRHPHHDSETICRVFGIEVGLGQTDVEGHVLIGILLQQFWRSTWGLRPTKTSVF